MNSKPSIRGQGSMEYLLTYGMGFVAMLPLQDDELERDSSGGAAARSDHGSMK